MNLGDSLAFHWILTPPVLSIRWNLRSCDSTSIEYFVQAEGENED